MTEEIARAMSAWVDGGTVDVWPAMRRFTSKVTATTLSAATLSEADQERALQDVSVPAAGTFTGMFLPPALTRLPTRGNRAYERTRARLRRTLGRLVVDYRRSGADHGDVLSMLLAADGESRPLTDTEVVDNLISLFVGGADTTANALSFAFHRLGLSPGVERRLHAEADTVLDGRTATLDDAPRLDLTRRVVTETLRLYPPVPMVTRTVVADSELGGHVLPAGTIVVFSPMTVRLRPDLFDGPGRFDPDRWERGAPRLPRGAFTPFGGGPRKCVGDGFGMTMAIVAPASIASRWRLEPVPGGSAHPVLHTFLAPRDLRMRTVARRP